jgi:hypothetical protein
MTGTSLLDCSFILLNAAIPLTNQNRGPTSVMIPGEIAESNQTSAKSGISFCFNVKFSAYNKAPLGNEVVGNVHQHSSRHC